MYKSHRKLCYKNYAVVPFYHISVFSFLKNLHISIFFRTFVPKMAKLRTYLTLILLCAWGTGVCAETETSKQVPAKPKYPMRTMLMLNAGISDYRQPALGFTIARVGQWGYYANFMIGLDNLHTKYDYRIDAEGRLLDGELAGVIPFYSGNRAVNRFSGSIGGMCRMGIPLYIYAGGGYGYRSETRKLLNGQWVQTANSLSHSGVVEAGLMGRVGNFTLLAGYTLFIGQQMRLYHEARVGIGYVIDK